MNARFFEPMLGFAIRILSRCATTDARLVGRE